MVLRWICLAVFLASLVNAALGVCTRFSSFNSNDDRPLPINGQVTFTCQVNTSVLFWTSSLFTEQTIVSSSNDGPLLINAPDVTANRLISVEDDCLTSQIMLTGPLQQANGAFVVCEDDDNPRNVIDNITINIATVSDSPQSLINISQTYESVLLNWTEPTDDGGRPIQYYSINVTGGPSDCTNGICITNSTSYNVTGLMFGVQYTFTISAINAVGMSAPSDELVVEVPGDVPDPVINIMYCIQMIFNSNKQLLLQWTPPAPLSTSPPITHYNVIVNNTLRCRNESNSSQIDCPFDLSVADEPMITADITAVNLVGNSTARSVSINVDLELLSITVINMTSDSVTIQCSTSYQSSANRYCSITITSPTDISGRSMFDGTDAVNVTFNNLMSGTTHMFTASLVNDSNHSFPSACITIVDSFTVESITPTMPSSSSMFTSPSDTSVTSSTVGTSDITSDSITSTSTSTVGGGTSNNTTGDFPVAATAGAVAGVVVFVAVLIIILIVGYCVYRAKKGSTKVNFGGGRNDRGSSAEPIAMVDRAAQETGYDPATALYAEPDKNPSANIRHEEPAPGVLYAQPDKSSRRNPPPQPHQPDPPPSSQPELATYQDPNTIQREAAPTGDLYALPEKTKPVYSEVNKNKTGIVYAALDLKDNPSATAAADDKPSIDVVYADVKKP